MRNQICSIVMALNLKKEGPEGESGKVTCEDLKIFICYDGKEWSQISDFPKIPWEQLVGLDRLDRFLSRAKSGEKVELVHNSALEGGSLPDPPDPPPPGTTPGSAIGESIKGRVIMRLPVVAEIRQMPDSNMIQMRLLFQLNPNP